MPKKQPAARRSPTPEEADAIERARAQREAKPKRVRPPAAPVVKVLGPDRHAIEAPHSDLEGWGIQLMESLGVDSYGVVERLMNGVAEVVGANSVPAQEGQDRINHGLMWVSSLEPRNALEATLATQMLATHEAAMKLAGLAQRASTREGLNDYANLMNKTMRTFAAQTEALAKLRTGGKQQVEVRYVYVDARTQTVVNPPIGGGQGGGLDNFAALPHAAGTLGGQIAQGVPVWGQDASGNVVPLPSGEGQEAMPDARGQKSRRA